MCSVRHIKEVRNAHKISVWKPKGKIQLRRPNRRRAKNNFKTCLEEKVYEVRKWNQKEQDRD